MSRTIASRIKVLFDWFLPSFDETTLFLLAVSCAWLLVSPSGMRQALIKGVTTDGSGRVFILIGWSALGLLLSIYHAFTNRPKNVWDKTSMAVFAMVTNVAAGVLVGFNRLNGGFGSNRALAFVNFGAALVLAYQVAWAEDRVVSDKDAPLSEILTGFVLMMALLLICEVGLRLAWPVTFSLCVTYSSFLHRNAMRVSRSAYQAATSSSSA